MATLLDALSIRTSGLILVLSFQFLLTFFKMADFQGINDSTGIFLSAGNFP